MGLRKATMTIIADETGDSSLGTYSRWVSDSCFECYILERPKKGMVAVHPRILDVGGIVLARLKNHPEHGICYELQMDKSTPPEPDRTSILIHSANWYQELLGCLAPGAAIVNIADATGKWLGQPMKSQMGVSSSDQTLKRLMDDLDGNDVQITIVR